MSHGRGVPARAIEFGLREAFCFVPKELATPCKGHEPAQRGTCIIVAGLRP